MGVWSSICRLLHWGPMTAIGIIKAITIMTLYMNSMWWPPNGSWAGYINSKIFMSWSLLTLFNFLMAAIGGPKHLPFNWRPEKSKHEQFLQYCRVCDGFKAPRSHHCRKCNRCVLKMDHHCPWINNCVGYGNHAYFTYFLLFAIIGCGHATYLLMGSLIRGLNMHHYLYTGQYQYATVEFTKISLVLCILALGLAIGVVLAVGMLFVFQAMAICRNRTGIEDWILEKAKYRREGTGEPYIFPYNLGLWKNIKQVFPALFSCAPVGDGIWWTVNEASDQFSLTLEQLAQKNEKRMRTKTYTIIHPSTGSWCPIWSQGLRISCQPPCTDEPRIKLQLSDIVRVTRWKKHWLFGERDPREDEREEMTAKKKGVPDAQQEKPKSKTHQCTRGWFPRRCAIELVENDREDRNYLSKQQLNHHHLNTAKDRKRK